MWGGEQPPAGTVTAVDLQGVRVMLGDGSSVLLGWEQVREVRGARRPQFEAIRDDARAVWRAHTRLRRGDLVNAEPLLEGLMDRYAGRAGPTSSLVARGLLRCRLARGARAAAVEAWLATLEAERWSPADGRAPDADGLIDAATGLAPAIPPVWLDDEQSGWLSVQGAGAAIDDDDTPRDRTWALGELYRISAAFETGGEGREDLSNRLAKVYELVGADLSRDPGLALVSEVVMARVGDPEQRASARRALEARLAQRPEPWREAWVRVAIGRSLILEADEEDRRRGVVQLMHLPARLGSVSPTLASIALAQGAVTLRELGDTRGASTLRSVLLEQYPASEGARWRVIQDWAAPSDRLGVRDAAPAERSVISGRESSS